VVDQRRARVIAGRVALVLAGVLLPLAMVSSWSSAILSDNDRYVDAVAPLASDPVVQRAVVDHLTEETLTLFSDRSTGPCGEASAQPPPAGGLGGLASAFLPLAEGPIRAILTGIVASPTFERAWVGANRSAHDQLIDVLNGDDRLVGDGCVSIDLGAVLAEAVPQLSALGGSTLAQTKIPVASIDTDDLGTARFGYAVLNPLGFWLPVLWLLSVLAAFALGRRRLRTLWILAASSAVGMAVLLIGLTAVRSALAGASGDPEVTKAVWDAVASSVRNAALLALGLSIVAAVVGGWLDRPQAPERAAVPERPLPPEDVWSRR
jgi:hypothetical protein